MPNDPLVAAIAVAIERMLERGIRVQPEGTGWLIRLTNEGVVEPGETPAEISRSW